MILECIVTTMDADGRVNIAPMGVIPRGEVVVLKPFKDTTTFRNLTAVGSAVLNITDDAGVFAYSALGDYAAELRPAAAVAGYYLADACAYWELEVLGVDATGQRAEIPCRVVRREQLRAFVGYNRARNAILEATILATRVHLLPADEIARELERLAVIVQKCGDAPEAAAMEFILRYVKEASPCRPE